MVSSSWQMLIILLWFLSATTLNFNMCYASMNVRCNEKDRYVLSIFKQGVEDPLKKLSSWSSEEDCCNWSGVLCDNITGRVTKLDLHCSYDVSYFEIDSKCLGGEINFALLELEFLASLDLHYNNFTAIRMPSIYGSTKSQKFHNLPSITSHRPLTNFSNLLYLDLSENENLYMDNLRWVSQLSSLKYLNLSEASLHKETHWLQWITTLPSLLELRMESCDLNGISPSLRYVNSSSLEVLHLFGNSLDFELSKWPFNLTSRIVEMDLFDNEIRGPIPKEILNLQNLQSLFLGWNHLNGSIPEWMGQYKHLEHLELYDNLFSGPIPATLGNLSSLKYLVVCYNDLNGSLPMSLWQLSKLESLELGYTSLSGVLSEQNFKQLSNLKDLQLDSTKFRFDVGPHWQPPFQLESLSMSSCMLASEFPSWLYTQKSLFFLDFSNSELSFDAQEKFWSFVAQIEYVDLSNNSIAGDVSNFLINSSTIFLDSNKIRGELPRLSPKVGSFSIANNRVSGSLFPLLCHIMSKKNELEELDLSHNILIGKLTNCWMYWKSLIHVNLGSNNFTGKIPHSMSSLLNLSMLWLNNNNLSGNIPLTLQSCKQLSFLDLKYNKISGNLVIWPSQLTVALLLRSNKFSGPIPTEICLLSNLLVLDLANNRFSGPIPKCLGNITTMSTNATNNFDHWIMMPIIYKLQCEIISVYIKGQELEYTNNFRLVRIVDLSNNALSGPIPPEVFNLTSLLSLNLSNNYLIGKIPIDVGHMKNLECLDLSSNQLSGEIPQSMCNLSFLNHLNLSNNNFIGRIPLGTQLQSFDASSYMGNPELCGAPLPINCTQEEEPSGLTQIEDSGDDSNSWFYIGLGVGFAFGFWVVCGSLFFIRSWRHAYFRLLNDIKDQLYITIALRLNSFC